MNSKKRFSLVKTDISLVTITLNSICLEILKFAQIMCIIILLINITSKYLYQLCFGLISFLWF